jgi:hypothetical protein
MMRVLIDSRGLQARQHLVDGQRLRTLLVSLRKDHLVDFSQRGKELSRELLRHYDVLIVLTWPAKKYKYDAEESKLIQDFVGRGNGLVLMSNHTPFDKNDGRLSAKFGVKIQHTFFRNHLDNVPTVLAGATLNADHQIVAGKSRIERVQSVVTNTSSSIRCEQGDRLISIPQEMVDQETEEPAKSNQLFAHALDMNKQIDSSGTGRLVTIADSGFIGSRWTEVPGPGLIKWGDNLQFVRNAIRWAGSGK